MSPTIRILIVDGHKGVRLALSTALAVEDDLLVVGEATTGSEALELTAMLVPDIVLMEINLPDRDGLSIVRLIRRLFPETRVVVLATVSTPDLRRQAQKAGAQGYLQKHVAINQVIELIRDVRNATSAPATTGDAK